MLHVSGGQTLAQEMRGSNGAPPPASQYEIAD
jgi:hypothetical protein